MSFPGYTVIWSSPLEEAGKGHSRIRHGSPERRAEGRGDAERAAGLGHPVRSRDEVWAVKHFNDSANRSLDKHEFSRLYLQPEGEGVMLRDHRRGDMLADRQAEHQVSADSECHYRNAAGALQRRGVRRQDGRGWISQQNYKGTSLHAFPLLL